MGEIGAPVAEQPLAGLLGGALERDRGRLPRVADLHSQVAALVLGHREDVDGSAPAAWSHRTTEPPLTAGELHRRGAGWTVRDEDDRSVERDRMAARVAGYECDTQRGTTH